MEIHDTRPPHLPPCPSCGLADRTAAVPAVYQAGRQQVTERIPATDDQPSHTVTREVRSPLAAALAPVPVRRRSVAPGLGIFLVLAAGLGFAAQAMINSAADSFTADQSGFADHGFGSSDPSFGSGFADHGFGSGFADRGFGSGFADGGLARPDPSFGHPDVSFLGWAAALALLGAVILFVVYFARRAEYDRLTAGRAAAEQLWARAWYCERCGTVHFPATPGEPSRPLGLQEFRTLVWTAGGYGRLVGQHPVV